MNMANWVDQELYSNVHSQLRHYSVMMYYSILAIG